MMFMRNERGMTVIEIIVVVGIGFILMAALLRFLSSGFPLSKSTALQIRSTETARVQLRRMANMLRELRYAENGAYPLVVTEDMEIIFYADVDADDSVERIRYELVDGDFIRGVIQPSGTPVEYSEDDEEVSVIARNIVNSASDPIFIYYSGDYPDDATTLDSSSITEVKYIEFHLLIDDNVAIDPPVIDLRSQVQLRNLKTNLGDV